MDPADLLAPGVFRDQVRSIVEQLSVLEGRWIDGTPPSPAAIEAVAEDLARLRARIATAGYVAPWDSQPRPRPTRDR